jgi:uncharacterized membrane protein YjgN (DUF898 family)
MNSEESYIETQPHRFFFKGKGSAYFSIVFVNFLLTIVTLGLYYPWAKCSKLKYLYENTEFADSPFAFLGNGKELFKGFIKLLVAAIIFFGIYASLAYNQQLVLAGIFLYSGLFLLVPIALHGSYRYRLSRTTWRNIHFGYRGQITELFSEWIIGSILSILTIGIYSPWFTTRIRKYMISKIRFGDVKFDYEGEGSELFVIHLKGIFLSILTLGIYSFWYTKDLYNYYINNITIEQNDYLHRVESKMTGGDFFELFIVNYILLVFTLGLAFPFVQVRTFKYLAEKLLVEGTFNPDAIMQTEEDYKDATGEDLASWLDIDLI